MSHLPSPATVARLVRADWIKLSHYWVVVAGYAAIVLVAVGGAVLYHLAETTANISADSGYDFAFAVMIRSLDFARSVLFLGWVGAAVTAAVLAGIAFKVAKDAYAQGDYTPTKETERPATA